MFTALCDIRVHVVEVMFASSFGRKTMLKTLEKCVYLTDPFVEYWDYWYGGYGFSAQRQFNRVESTTCVKTIVDVVCMQHWRWDAAIGNGFAAGSWDNNIGNTPLFGPVSISFKDNCEIECLAKNEGSQEEDVDAVIIEGTSLAVKFYEIASFCWISGSMVILMRSSPGIELGLDIIFKARRIWYLNGGGADINTISKWPNYSWTVECWCSGDGAWTGSVNAIDH
ncbi:hypothetical protein BDN71DRAFT_1436932 [Pleurotus eryngii]|uniref:Uncharacterized protein n=1 Tax=Pleurotus eryngii TaxID=5323 RepID=A0A9P5ZJ71_PLEER|nr:hypothetical protein BDN71DRAFT_1436932 [Pleurotus eryngii]